MIRDAVIDDIDAIVEMAVEFWKLNPLGENIPADKISIEMFVKFCLEQKLLCVLSIDDVIEGFAAGIKSVALGNSSVAIGTELAWWVNPDHRHGRNGIGLMIYLERLAKKAGIRFWSMVFMQTSMPDEIQNIYEKLNYNKTETSYTKELI